MTEDAIHERLRASEAGLRTLLEVSPDAVLVTDQSGTIRFANAPPGTSWPGPRPWLDASSG